MNDSDEFFPETPEDSRFLMDIPEDQDMTAACLRLQDKLTQIIENMHMQHRVFLLTAIKEVLGLEGYTGNSNATMVILNAIRETEDMVGFPSPEIILQLLSIRRKKYKELLTGAK